MAKRKKGRPAAPAQVRRFPDWLPHVLVLAALAVAVYANSIGNDFVGDDKMQLVGNALLNSFRNIPRILGSSVWAFGGVRGNYYRPLQFLIYLFLVQGAGFHAPAFHLFMVLLHALNTALLYLLVRRMAATRVALAAAVLFAVHPIHTEVIDWIAALPDLMATTLALIGVLWLAGQNGAPRGLQIAGHCGIYLLALLTKETGVMLLPLYAGYGFFPLRRGWQELRRNLALYASMAATLVVYLAMRWSALGGLAPGQQTFFRLTPGEFALSLVVTAARYLEKLVLPAGLNYFHVFHPAQAIAPAFLISAAALALVAAIFLRVRIPLFRYGIFWMAVTLTPALNLTGVGQNVFAERYLYLPSAGFCWVAGLSWDWMAARRPQWAWVAAAAITLVCVAEVMARNRDWRDDFTLLQVTVRQSPDAGWVHDTLAGAYVGRNEFEQALQQERLAVQCEPQRAIFRRKLGYLLLGKDPGAAVAEFRKVMELEPSTAQGHADLGLALETEGDARGAADEYRRALQLQPQYREAQEGYQRVESKLR